MFERKRAQEAIPEFLFYKQTVPSLLPLSLPPSLPLSFLAPSLIFTLALPLVSRSRQRYLSRYTQTESREGRV